MKPTSYSKRLILMLCGILLLQTLSLYFISTRETASTSIYLNPPEQASNQDGDTTKKVTSDQPLTGSEGVKPREAIPTVPDKQEEADVAYLRALNLAQLLEEHFEATESVVSLDYSFEIAGVTIQETPWHLPVSHNDYLIHLIAAETAHAKRYDLVLIHPDTYSLTTLQLATEPLRTHPFIGYINWLSQHEMVLILNQMEIKGEMSDARYEIFTLDINTGDMSSPFNPIELKHQKFDGPYTFGWTELEQDKRLVLNIYSDGSTFVADFEDYTLIELVTKIKNPYPIFLIYTPAGASAIVSFDDPHVWSLFNSKGELILKKDKKPSVTYSYPNASWHKSGSKFVTAYAYNELYELAEGQNYPVFALQGMEIYSADGTELLLYETPQNRYFDIIYWYEQELLIHEYSLHKGSEDWYYSPVDSRYYLLNEETGSKLELQSLTDATKLNPSYEAVQTKGGNLSQGYLLSRKENAIYLFTGEYEEYLTFVEIGDHQYYVHRANSSYFYLDLANGVKEDIDLDSKGQLFWDVEFYFMPKWRLDYSLINEKKIVYTKNFLYY